MLSYPRVRGTYDIFESGQDLIFRSNHNIFKVEGKDIQEFVKDVLPLLDGTKSLEQIYESLSEYQKEDVDNCLSLLQKNGLLEEGNLKVKDTDNARSYLPFINFLEDSGISAEDASSMLKKARIAILGLGAHGAILAHALANEGIGFIRCIDPTLVSNEDLYLSPIYELDDRDKRRDEALIERLRKSFPQVVLESSYESEISEDRIESLIKDCDLVVSCVDKGFSSINYWINKITLRTKVPWFSATLDGSEGTIGPLIIPNETACFMCYTMRLVANEKSYEDAMAYRKYLSERKKDELSKRSNIATNANILANFLALEILRQVTGFAMSPLVGKIYVINFLTLNTEFHSVLRKPNCPHCGIKKKIVEPDTTNESIRLSDIVDLESELLSPRVGIIKSMHRVLKDSMEPEVPFIFGVVLSNFNYHDKEDENWAMCSGKGMTIEEAKTSALGEAIERYCGGHFDEELLITKKYQEIEGKALNPVSLVLFSDQQYSNRTIPYSRFSSQADMKWIEGYLWIKERSVLVPAISVYMDYSPMGKEEYLFSPTSNGLAAGSTYRSAVLSGLLEVIERDAFLITWLCKLPMPTLDLTSFTDKRIQDIINRYARRGIAIYVNALILDTGIPSFLASAVDTSGRGPAICVGLAAHPNPEIGVFKALLEVGQIRPHLRREMRKQDYEERSKNLLDFDNVKTIQDHELLYTNPRMLPAFDFLLNNGQTITVRKIRSIFAERAAEGDLLSECLAMLRNCCEDVISVDVTTSDIRQFGLSVVRVIVPEFQPIHFGHKEIRLGGKRLFALPEKLGFYEHQLSAKDLNPNPHPLG